MKSLTNETKLILWGKTIKASEIYPLGRSEESIAQQKFETYLHKVMFRTPGLDYWLTTIPLAFIAMSLSQTSVQQLAKKIAALVVDDLADEVAELVHTSVS